MQLPDLQDDVNGGPYLLYNYIDIFEVTLQTTFSINLSPSNNFKQENDFINAQIAIKYTLIFKCGIIYVTEFVALNNFVIINFDFRHIY